MDKLPPDLKAIFGKALELESPADRARYLDEACGENAGLRAELESLLTALGHAGSFLESPAAAPTVTAAPTPIIDGPGTIIGPYKLLEQIGEGGMGFVYMAEQSRPVRRKVALKIIKPGMDTKQVIARFEAERQALALMDHPNIAKVFDAGATESGRPYFVMELVRGIPITGYCDQVHLPIPERLALFVQVCLAVQHAHQKGIIHRDLKPSNLLVTLHDGVPMPKVIDFGIAKATGQHLTEKTLFTGFAQLVGTPLYMSPEQAALSALDIDTRSDVYSLGVLLYELLTGTTPFDQDTFRKAALDEIRRIIREQEPPKPSTRVSALGMTATTTSANRQADPRRLGKLMRGELDWIVMKCLEKDRTRRYDTVNGLAADVRRYLAQEPVEAGPPSAWYRLRKLARRNRAALATASVVAASLVAVAALSLLYADRQRRTASEKAESARKITVLAGDLKTSLAESNRLLAIRNFDRGQAAFEQDQIGPGLLWMIESWRSAIAAGDPAWQHAARANLAAWQRHHPRLQSVLSHPAPVDAAAFGPPNGKRVAISGDDGTARLWDVVTGEPIGSPLRHRGPILAVTFGPDGKVVLTGADDGTARLWDAATGQALGMPLRHEDTVTCLAFSPDGKIILTGSLDGTARLWDVSGAPLGSPLGHPKSVLCAAFSSDGKMILTGSHDGEARLWSVATGKALGSPMLHRQPVQSVAFSPDSKSLITGARDGTVRLWDATGVPLGPPLQAHGYRVRSVAFSPDGKFFLTGGGDNLARIWDAATGLPVGRSLPHQGPVTTVAFTPDGTSFLTGCSDGTVRLWDADIRQPAGLVLEHPDFVFGAVFSPDGKKILAGSKEDDGGAARLWDVATGRAIGVPFLHDGRVAAVAFSPDGKTVLTGSRDGVARLWQMATFRPVGRPLGHDGKEVSVAAFSPDGKTIVTGGQDGTCRFWDTATGTPLSRPLEQPGTVDAAALSRDGRLLFTGYNIGTGQVWDLRSLRPRGPSLRQPGAFSGAAFSPDGTSLLTGCEDGLARFWDLASGTLRHPPLVHRRWVWSVAISPDGKFFLTGSHDGTARLWDAATGVLLGPPLSYRAAVMSVAFSPDGNSFAVGTETDSAVRVFKMAPELSDDFGLIALWAEVLTGLTLDNQRGSIQVLDHAAWLKERERLRQQGGPPKTEIQPRLDPILFGSDPTARARAFIERGWSDQAEAALAEAAQARPYNPAITIERARFFIAHGQPAKAAVVCAQAIPLQLQSRELALDRGLILSLLAAGDHTGLQAACTDMLGRHGNSPDRHVGVRVTWNCALGPSAVVDREVVERLAGLVVSATTGGKRPEFLRTLGAAQYRAGRFEEAIRALEESIRMQGGAGSPQDWTFLALAHHRLGHDMEAHSWLERFQTYRPSERPGDFWDELEVRLLRREAEAVVLYDPVFPTDPFARP